MVREGEDFTTLIGPTVWYLNHRLALDISIDTYALDDLDRSNILPHHWEDLAALIKDKYDDYESFIITHGTNTLGYTCAALSFALPNPAKPIILTGSQVSAWLPGSDAHANLENAVRVAVWKRLGDGPPIRGVIAVFGSHIITGTPVTQVSQF